MEIKGKLLADGFLVLYFSQFDSIFLQLAKSHSGLLHGLPR